MLHQLHRICLVYGFLLRLPAEALSVDYSLRQRSPLPLLFPRQTSSRVAEHRGATTGTAFHRLSQATRLHSKDQTSGTDPEQEEFEVVYINTSQEDIPEDVQATLVDNQPSQWAIMKEVGQFLADGLL